MLTVDGVRQVRQFLEAMPFTDMAMHLSAAANEPLIAVRNWDEECIREQLAGCTRK
jgi:hypothetical protein